MNSPFISVIVPVYNCSRYVGECIESILSGNETVNFELVLIDDGSSDNSLQICGKYASIYPDKIKVWHKVNGGVSSARNYGLDKAIGEWIIFVDADDTLANGTLDWLQNILIEGNFDLLQFGLSRGWNGTKESVSSQLVTDYVAGEHCHVCIGGNVFKSRLIKEHSIYFDEEISLAEDQLFVMTYLRNASRVRRIADILYEYRENASSASNTPSSDKLLVSYYKLLDFKKDNELFSEIIDVTLVSHMYVLVLHGEVNLKELETLYRESKISAAVMSSDKGSRGTIVFKRMIGCLNFRISSVVVRFLKRIYDAKS